MLTHVLLSVLAVQPPVKDELIEFGAGQMMVLDQEALLDVRFAKWCEDIDGQHVYEGYWMSNEAGAQKAAESKALKLALEEEKKKNEEQAAPGKLGLLLGAAGLLLGGVFIGARLTR